MIRKMENYLEPADIYKTFGIESFEQYLERYLVTGNFHQQVPEPVKKSFLVAEHIMAHAYFFWPLYDEALHKILGVFEMSIVIRCKQLGIIKPDNYRRLPRLSELIKKLTKQLGLAAFEDYFNAVKNLRNSFAHPKDHSFMGGTSKHIVVKLVNLINIIFLDEIWPREIVERTADQNKHLGFNESSVFVIPYQGKRILGFAPKVFSAISIKGQWYYAVTFSPVLNLNTIPDDVCIERLLFLVKDVQITSKGISGFEFGSQSEIVFEVTNNERDKSMFETFRNQLQADGETPLSLKEAVVNLKLGSKMEELIYEHCWN